MNLLIRARRAMLGGSEPQAAFIRVEDGKFTQIDPTCTIREREGEIALDAGDLLLLPGMIDGHVHFDDPGYTWRETIETGTAAAAAGGVTCIVDMPCTSIPAVTTAENLRTKQRALSGRAHVDFMFWGGVCANMMEADTNWAKRLEELAAEGVAAIKCYMLSGMDSFRDLNHEQMLAAAKVAGGLGLPLGVHAEDRDTVEAMRQKVEGMDLHPAERYYRSRSGAAEIEAARRVIDVAQKSRAHLHIVHLGSGQVLDMIGEARAAGCRVTAESAPHYLSFVWQDLLELGSLLKTAPVVKEAEDRDRLWQGVLQDEFAFLATDHAAGKWPQEKQTGDFERDYGGVPGVELLLPWLYTRGVSSGEIGLDTLCRLLASGPAEFFGISRRKGRISLGHDADFVLMDDACSWTVRACNLHNLNRYTPFEGQEFKARVMQTWLRGRQVYSFNGGELQSGDPRGIFIPREERNHV
jgi:allantoinase